MHRAPRLILAVVIAVPAIASADSAEAPAPSPAVASAESPTPSSAVASPESPTPPVEAPGVTKRLGVGYKAGNGIGFMGGDVIINVFPHVALDLQAAYFSAETTGGQQATGYAFAPAVQGHLFAGQRSTPYVAVGMQYARMSFEGVTASGVGMFANVGYEWKWQSGLGIQLGGGVQYLGKMQAMSGNTTITRGGSAAPNLELSLRYLFL